MTHKHAGQPRHPTTSDQHEIDDDDDLEPIDVAPTS
jgi:hypothetical protein